ncbi:MAG: ribbon-helix-helix domain-containing protein [Methylobacteriaceae bacterium]|nr:ribbon-helix-helix domain-containing protein [Methylobacteriaceae bacterium]
MPHGINKYSVSILGHRTSISLEPEFWKALSELAARQNRKPADIIREIDSTRATRGLSSAIRVYVLEVWKQGTGISPQHTGDKKRADTLMPARG